MPAPAVYILAIVGAVAAGFAFKEFVYEPHIAPKVEQWAEEFIAKRRARRQRAQPIPAAPSADDRTPSKRGKHPDSQDDRDETRQSIELENLVAREVGEWRAEVSRSQTSLRHRVNAARLPVSQGLSEASSTAVNNVPSIVESPTHILFDPQIPLSPASSAPSAGPTPSPRVSTLRETTSSPTPAPTNNSTSPDVLRGPLSPTTSVPSLSQSYAPDLDHEQGLEFLSAPSSRPESPFSSLSQPLSPHDTGLSSSQYYSFSSPNALSPQNATLSVAHSPSRTLSDLDFLSEFDPLSPRSSTSNIPPAGPARVVDDETGSDDGSSSSWDSANLRRLDMEHR